MLTTGRKTTAKKREKIKESYSEFHSITITTASELLKKTIFGHLILHTDS